MTVDPEEILIFKMRGMTTVKKTVSKPQASVQIQVQPAKVETVPEMEQEKPPLSKEEEVKLRELASLEQMVSLYANQPAGVEVERAVAKQKVHSNTFSTIAGVLFLANAAVFGYFISSQAIFVINYISTNGFSALFANWSYEYGTALINLILTMLMALGGLLILGRARGSYLLSGLTGAIVLLAVSFEYLTSNADYLLVVILVAFLGIALLAWSRMSAVEVAEREFAATTEINWPRIETF